MSIHKLHTKFFPLFENAALLREILTWGRDSSRQVQDLESEVGGGEQQRSCSPETCLQLQRYEVARHRIEEIQCAVTRELNNISKTAFLEGMKKLKERANKCIDQGEMYFEG
jgi:hypothetical protein